MNIKVAASTNCNVPAAEQSKQAENVVLDAKIYYRYYDKETGASGSVVG
jgi:hypothetical protein